MAIKILDAKTISKISAGEVIENPASVVKELVENSIDAGAKHIVVEINEGGTKSIKVTDDGSGFDKSDMALAFLQHATSKLSDITDLETINSFGFRGEALASIASVSKITLVSKKKGKDAFGYKYCIGFGNKSQIEEVAANLGTNILVEGLFENVPVRKKFLKGFNKENALVEDVVIKFALVRSDISFELFVDGRKKFSSSGNANLKDVIFSLYGREIVDNLIEINEVYDGITINGYIAKPIIARNTRNDEIYFVNDRYVKDKIISRAIEGAYEGYLMQHKFPLVVLKFSVDSKKVDVNVHPKKMEVRFSDEEQIFNATYSTIKNTLKNASLIHEEKLSYDIFSDTSHDIVKNDEENDNAISEVPLIKVQEVKDVETLPTMSESPSVKIKEGLNIQNLHDKLFHKYEEKPFIQKTLSEDHKYIGQIFNTYILVEFDGKLYIIDQHAAHEKINYERIMKMYREGKVLNQRVMPSIVCKLTPIQYDAVMRNIDSFKKIGYEIEAFGDNDIKVDSVPYNLFNISSEKVLMDMIDSFTDISNKEQYDSIAEKIASISCKKAIKANDVLSENEVKDLLRNLFSLDNPYNCPHGRPTIISLSKYEFEKKFGRIV